jgi:hypothetical protein
VQCDGKPNLEIRPDHLQENVTKWLKLQQGPRQFAVCPRHAGSRFTPLRGGYVGSRLLWNVKALIPQP